MTIDHPVRPVFSPTEKMFACNLKLKGKKYPSITRHFNNRFRRGPPTRQGINKMVRNLNTKYTTLDCRKGRSGRPDQCQWELCRTLQRSGDLLKEQLQGSLASQVHHPEGIMSSSPKHPTTESPRKISSWSRTKSCVKVVSAVISWIVRIKSLDTFWTRKMWVFIYHCVYILLHNLVWFYPFLKILDSILMRMNWGWSQNIYFLL